MSVDYSTGRLHLLDTLLKRRQDISGGRLWTLDPASLRFRHGESIAELKVPYHMGGDDEACIENAVLGLLSLLLKRAEPVHREGPREPAQAQPILPPVAPPKDKTYRTDIFIAGSLEKRLAEEVLASAPQMDASILAAWLAADGYGRGFMKWTAAVFDKALREEAKHGGRENTSYLVLLAAINTIRKKKERIKEFRVKGLPYEKLDLAVGITLFVAFSWALKDLFARLKAEEAAYYSPASEALLLSAAVPKSFLSISANLLSSTLNPYGMNAETHDLVAPYAADLARDAVDSSELIRLTAERIRPRVDALEALRQMYEARRFREEMLKYLTEFDIPGGEAHAQLYDLYNEDRLIRNFMGDAKAAVTLSRALDEVKKFYRDARSLDAIASFQRYLASFKRPVLGSLLKASKKDSFEAVLPMLEGFYACRFDDHVEKYAGLMRAYMADRRGDFGQAALIEEYNGGRLYRFSTDDRPVLKGLKTGEEGQLFIDMKDFTRKTLKVKEIAMAEFMKENFYGPILAAAARYGAGSALVSDESGIRLTNLPGDAAIFSGGVSNLVALARDIQQVIRRYREHLLKKLPPRDASEVLDEVHGRFEARKDELKARRDELKGLEEDAPGLSARLAALGEEEHRLENTYRDELEAAISNELEAGLYISYGAKPETMSIDSPAEFSGPVKVSIGGRINEAARGTFRNPMVRAKLEMLIENGRRKGKRNLKYPLDVYIDRIYSVKMPPELDAALEKLMAKRTPSSAQAMAKVMANEFFNDLKKMVSGEAFSSMRLITAASDIYNKGQAISMSALQAYINETRGVKFFFRKSVETGELDASLQESFFLPISPIEFWFGHEVAKGTERVEAFFRSGEVVFKGFESNTPTVVYEILNPEGDLFKALVKHHFPAWLEEARKKEGAGLPV
jgi:hypothetical protein